MKPLVDIYLAQGRNDSIWQARQMPFDRFHIFSTAGSTCSNVIESIACLIFNERVARRLCRGRQVFTLSPTLIT